MNFLKYDSVLTSFFLSLDNWIWETLLISFSGSNTNPIYDVNRSSRFHSTDDLEQTVRIRLNECR